MSVSVLHVAEGRQRPGNWPVVSHRERERERGMGHARQLFTARVSLIRVHTEVQLETFIAGSEWQVEVSLG